MAVMTIAKVEVTVYLLVEVYLRDVLSKAEFWNVRVGEGVMVFDSVDYEKSDNIFGRRVDVLPYKMNLYLEFEGDVDEEYVRSYVEEVLLDKRNWNVDFGSDIVDIVDVENVEVDFVEIKREEVYNEYE